MNYISTRGYEGKFSSSEAIIRGIAPDGGLFVPESIPQLTKQELQPWQSSHQDLQILRQS